MPNQYVRSDPEERFWAKVNKQGPKRRWMKTRCWVWTAGTMKGFRKDGYEYAKYGHFHFEGKTVKAHRMAWYFKYGEWPSSQIDHLCRRHGCVRPSHLEDVTALVNIQRGKSPSAKNARKQTCKRNHPLIGNNLRINSKGARVCIECARMHGRINERKRREKMGAAYAEYERNRYPKRKAQRAAAKHGTGE